MMTSQEDERRLTLVEPTPQSRYHEEELSPKPRRMMVVCMLLSVPGRSSVSFADDTRQRLAQAEAELLSQQYGCTCV